MATEVTPRTAGSPPATSAGAQRSGPPAPAEDRAGSRVRRALLTAVALLAALVALVCAAALPLAPVERDVPVVTWPRAPAAPVTTTLGLVSHAPASLRVETTCATARAAGQRGGDVLFSTMDPTSPRAAQQGVLWWVDGGDLRLDVAGTTVDSSPLAAGDCTLALVTVPVRFDPERAKPGAGPGTASDAGAGSGLQLRRDGVDVGDPVPGMPETDTLATGLTSLDAGAGERLSVALAVDDEFASSPTPLKTALVAMLLVAGVVVLVCLGLLDRARRAGRSTTSRSADGRRAPPRWRATLRPRWPDAATVVLALAWTPLAPMTDDDGYYAAMARDVAHSGYVGQYYQLFDQSFVPLTWPWYALSWWQQVADTPLGLRVPALVMVVATWVFVRRGADLLLGDHPRWGRARGGAVLADGARLTGGVLRSRPVWLLALAYAAAWTPYVMGVRPEAVSALGSAIALVGVLTTVRTGRLLPLALGVVAAAMAAASHPTGAVAIAPLVAGLPAAWRAIRATRLWLTLVRVVLVVAPGAMATAAGFADGTLYDFVRGREVFKAVQTPDAWTDEWIRYGFLLNPDIPMGAYAKRVTVLVALLAITVSLLLVAAARGRRLADDLGSRALATAGTTALLGFVALWVTPSKWTHHFGALSALTPLVLLAVLLLGPDLARRALASRGGGAVGLGVVAAVVAVAAVAMTGQDGWAYSWALGMPRYGRSPYVSVVDFSLPLTWLVVAGAVAAVLWLIARRGRRARSAGGGTAPAMGARAPSTVAVAPRSSLALRTAAVTTVVLLVVSTGYLLATFAQAAAATAGTYSPQASRLLDPLDRGCGAAGAISVVDDRRATALAPADVTSAGAARPPGGGETAALAGGATSAPADAFTAGDGAVWVGDPAPPVPGAAQVWGSLAGGNTPVGELTTGWYDLDGALADPGRRAVTALVTGNLLPEDGDAVVAEYGVRRSDGSVRTTTAQQLGDGVSTTEWRTVRLGGPAPAPSPERPEPTLVPQVLGPDGEPLRYRPRAAEEADVVRLRAVDAATGPGGWVATSAPSVAPMTTMERYLPRRAVVATSWQMAYHFPCQRQVAITHGITDRPAYAALWGDGPLEGTGDSVWQPGRGGLYSQVPGASTLTRLETGFTDAPGTRWGQLARIDWPDAPDAFDVALLPQTTSGVDGPTLPDLARLVPAGP